MNIKKINHFMMRAWRFPLHSNLGDMFVSKRSRCVRWKLLFARHEKVKFNETFGLFFAFTTLPVCSRVVANFLRGNEKSIIFPSRFARGSRVGLVLPCNLLPVFPSHISVCFLCAPQSWVNILWAPFSQRESKQSWCYFGVRCPEAG